jgi:hypothetical protein
MDKIKGEKMDDQEKYLAETPLLWSKNSIICRGIKKLITELTSVKTLFLAFLCVAMAHKWIGDIAGIVGGLAVLGVKEVPPEALSSLMQKIIPK